jgi:hypothetical protein
MCHEMQAGNKPESAWGFIKNSCPPGVKFAATIAEEKIEIEIQ